VRNHLSNTLLGCTLLLGVLLISLNVCVWLSLISERTNFEVNTETYFSLVENNIRIAYTGQKWQNYTYKWNISTEHHTQINKHTNIGLCEQMGKGVESAETKRQQEATDDPLTGGVINRTNKNINTTEVRQYDISIQQNLSIRHPYPKIQTFVRRENTGVKKARLKSKFYENRQNKKCDSPISWANNFKNDNEMSTHINSKVDLDKRDITRPESEYGDILGREEIEEQNLLLGKLEVKVGFQRNCHKELTNFLCIMKKLFFNERKFDIRV
jgi:hypothetical protein